MTPITCISAPSRLAFRRAIAGLFAALLLAAFVAPTAANAQPLPAAENKISKVEIEVQLLADGSALVTDRREFIAEEGTEHYLPLGNLGETEVQDFRVMLDGQMLTDIGEWNPEASLEEKTGKSGIRAVSDGVELCFGIGSLGEHFAGISYRLTNFVRNLEGGEQAVYWQFVNPGSNPIDAASVTIYPRPEASFPADSVHLAAYGFEGNTSVEAEQLSVTANGISKDQYLVVLAIFPAGTVNTDAQWNMTSTQLQEKADAGADGESRTILGLDENVFVGGIFGVSAAIIGGVGTVLWRKNAQKRAGTTVSASGFDASSSHIQSYRGIPFEGDPLAIAGLMTEAVPRTKLNFIVFEWLRDGLLVPVGEPPKGLDAAQRSWDTTVLEQAKEAGALQLRPENLTPMDPVRAELWQFLEDAADENNLLTAKGLKKFASENSDRLTTWGENAAKYSDEQLLRLQLVRREETGPKKYRYFKLVPTPAGQRVVDRIIGFTKYLEDLSQEDFEALHRQPWNKVIPWAILLNYDAILAEQISELDPQRRSAVSGDYYPVLFYSTAYSNSAGNASGLQGGSSGGSVSFSGGAGAAGASFGGGTR